MLVLLIAFVCFLCLSDCIANAYALYYFTVLVEQNARDHDVTTAYFTYDGG